MAKPGEHKIVPCIVCGLPYRQSKSYQMYCSRRCCSSAFRGRKPPVLRSCKHCGKEFVRRESNQRYCDRNCATLSDRLRLQAKNTGEGKHWSKGKAFVSRRKCQICGKEFYAPPVLIKRGGGKFCSNSCRGKDFAVNPDRYPQTKGRRGIGGKREDLNNKYFRSMWEANWARYLNWLIERGSILRWEYEPETFEFPVKRGSRFYTPDFKVFNSDGSCEFHEVKGWMDQKSVTKLKRMEKYYPEVEIILVDKEVYRSVANKVGRLIKGWETVRGNVCRND